MIASYKERNYHCILKVEQAIKEDCNLHKSLKRSLTMEILNYSEGAT